MIVLLFFLYFVRYREESDHVALTVSCEFGNSKRTEPDPTSPCAFVIPLPAFVLFVYCAGRERIARHEIPNALDERKESYQILLRRTAKHCVMTKAKKRNMVQCQICKTFATASRASYEITTFAPASRASYQNFS